MVRRAVSQAEFLQADSQVYSSLITFAWQNLLQKSRLSCVEECQLSYALKIDLRQMCLVLLFNALQHNQWIIGYWNVRQQLGLKSNWLSGNLERVTVWPKGLLSLTRGRAVSVREITTWSIMIDGDISVIGICGCQTSHQMLLNGCDRVWHANTCFSHDDPPTTTFFKIYLKSLTNATNM